MKKAFAICLMALAVASHARGQQATSAFSYNFFEGQYVNMNDLEPDGRGNGNDPDGLRINGSFDVAPSFSIIGSVTGVSEGRFDLNILTVGGAYHQALPKVDTMPLDLVVRAEVERVDAEIDGWPKNFRYDEIGILLSGGLQLAIADRLDAFGDIVLSSNKYRELGVLAGIRFEFVPALEGTASIEIGDIDALALGLRYNF